MKSYTLIKLNAGNDINGNPRRVFVGLDNDGRTVGAWDEGYSGGEAVPSDFQRRAGLIVAEFATTPKQYRAILRDYGTRWEAHRKAARFNGLVHRAADPAESRATVASP